MNQQIKVFATKERIPEAEQPIEGACLGSEIVVSAIVEPKLPPYSGD